MLGSIPLSTTSVPSAKHEQTSAVFVVRTPLHACSPTAFDRRSAGSGPPGAHQWSAGDAGKFWKPRAATDGSIWLERSCRQITPRLAPRQEGGVKEMGDGGPGTETKEHFAVSRAVSCRPQCPSGLAASER